MNYNYLKGYTIILNGAPFTGKDEIAHQMWVDNSICVTLMFKEKLYEVAACLADIPLHMMKHLATQRELKEVYSEHFKMSPREWLIKISEEIIKPNLGKNYFGKMLAQNIKDNYSKDLCVVSDGGFIEEIIPLVNLLGGSKIIVVRLHREGCTFTSDSRKHLSKEQLEPLGVMSYDYYNTAPTVDEMYKDFKERLFDFFEKNCYDSFLLLR